MGFVGSGQNSFIFPSKSKRVVIKVPNSLATRVELLRTRIGAIGLTSLVHDVQGYLFAKKAPPPRTRMLMPRTLCWAEGGGAFL